MNGWDALTRDVTAALTPQAATPVQRRHGIVTAVAAGPPPSVSVTVGATTIVGVRFLRSYFPAVGDEVFVDFNGPDPLVVGGPRPVAALPATPYTPTNVNVTVGNGTQTAAWRRFLNGMIWWRYDLVWGTTTSYGGVIQVGLPVAAVAGTLQAVAASCLDLSGGFYAGVGVVGHDSATTCRVVTAAPPSVNATAPFTWTTGDRLSISGTYEPA